VVLTGLENVQSCIEQVQRAKSTDQNQAGNRFETEFWRSAVCHGLGLSKGCRGTWVERAYAMLCLIGTGFVSHTSEGA
jgi:hypothetical protein